MRKIFHLDPTEARWTRILAWWEIRRPLYNVLLLIFLAFSISTLSTLPNEGYIQLQVGPALALTTYVAVVFYFIIANACYTGGFAIQLISRNLKPTAMIKKHISNLFLYGVVFSLFVSVMPLFIALINLCLGLLK